MAKKPYRELIEPLKAALTEKNRIAEMACAESGAIQKVYDLVVEAAEAENFLHAVKQQVAEQQAKIKVNEKRIAALESTIAALEKRAGTETFGYGPPSHGAPG